MVERGLRYSMNGTESPAGRMRWFGRNLSASALGVGSVWMKIVRRDDGARKGLLDTAACNRGRGLEDSEVMERQDGAVATLVWKVLKHVEGLAGLMLLLSTEAALRSDRSLAMLSVCGGRCGRLHVNGAKIL